MHSLTLQTGEATVVDGDILGRLGFAASSEVDGMLDVTAKLEAVAEKEFDDNENATEFVFSLAADGTVASKMTLGSTGLLTLTGNLLIPNGGNIGSVGDPDAIAIATGGVVTMNQIPVFSAGINVSGGTIAGTIATVTQNSITTMTGLVTVGTIGTGVWQGTKIASGYIADDAIDSQHYADGSIDNAHIADDAIDSEHYADGSIDNAHIADDAIDSEHYADGSIDNAHIADDAIDSEHYADGSIDTAHIADNAITLAKLAGGTDGQIITFDASGNPVAVGPGSDGEVLTSTGAGSPPAFEEASGGGSVSGNTFATDLKIGRDSQNLVDFATTDDKIIFRVANVDEVELVANVLSPVTSDGMALGTGSLMWSDLFLASGSVINFNNGDITLTHSADTLTLAGTNGTLVSAPASGASGETWKVGKFTRTAAGNVGVVIDASAVNADEDAELRLKTGVSGKSRVFFGDTDDSDIGQLSYDHSDDSLTIKTNAAAAVVIDSNGTLATKGIIRAITTKVDTDDYTALATDHIILVDTTDGDRNINLPVAAPANIGQEYTIKKIDSGTGIVNIIPSTTAGYGPDDIDEYNTKYILYLQHDTVTFVCGPGDATAGDEQWWITAEKVTPHSAQLEQRTAQSLSARTTTALTMTHVLYEQGCDADTATNRIDIKRPGKYLVIAHASLDNLPSLWGMHTFIGWYDLSATTTYYRGNARTTSYVEVDVGVTTSTLLDLASGDYVQAIGWNAYVGALNTKVGGAHDYPYISVEEIR